MQPILALTTSDPTAAGVGAPYDDDPRSHYEADSDVQNHRQLVQGNVMVVAQDRVPTTFARIGEVTQRAIDKPKIVCPECNRTRTNFKLDDPGGKCYSCGYTGRLGTQDFELVRYRASFDRVLDIEGVPFEAVRSAQANAATTSIRKLDESQLYGVLLHHGFRPDFGFEGVDTSAIYHAGEGVAFPGGSHEMRGVQRANQARWREALELRQGGVCAITGGARPRAAREGAHLIRWDPEGPQDPDHGMLLRRDLHGLEEAGLLRFAVRDDTGEVRVQLHPSLREDRDYGPLHGQPVALPPEKLPPREILKRHHRDQSERGNWP